MVVGAALAAALGARASLLSDRPTAAAASSLPPCARAGARASAHASNYTSFSAAVRQLIDPTG